MEREKGYWDLRREGGMKKRWVYIVTFREDAVKVHQGLMVVR